MTNVLKVVHTMMIFGKLLKHSRTHAHTIDKKEWNRFFGIFLNIEQRTDSETNSTWLEDNKWPFLIWEGELVSDQFRLSRFDFTPTFLISIFVVFFHLFLFYNFHFYPWLDSKTTEQQTTSDFFLKKNTIEKN